MFSVSDSLILSPGLLLFKVMRLTWPTADTWEYFWSGELFAVCGWLCSFEAAFVAFSHNTHTSTARSFVLWNEGEWCCWLLYDTCMRCAIQLQCCYKSTFWSFMSRTVASCLMQIAGKISIFQSWTRKSSYGYTKEISKERRWDFHTSISIEFMIHSFLWCTLPLA